MHLGIDLDNTVISYDEVFLFGALELKLVPIGWEGSRLQVRDYVRHQKDGDIAWQRLQGKVYGKWLHLAKLFPGVYRFLWRCKYRNIVVDIVSHKTEYGHLDDEKISLRKSALDFLIEHEVLSMSSESLINKIDFFSRKEEKLEHISKKQFDWFIDDLPEIVEHDEFPRKTKTFGFDPTGASGFRFTNTVKSWAEIENYVLGKWLEDEVKDFASRVSDRAVIDCKWQSGRGNSGIKTKNIGGRRNAGISRVEMIDGAINALKIYPVDYHHDRLFSEYEGLRLLRQRNIKQVPRPIASDRKMQAAMYEWIEGEPVENLRKNDLDQALDLLANIHSLRGFPEFSTFPGASAAIFSGHQLEKQIYERLWRLRDQSVKSSKLKAFLTGELEPMVKEILKWSRMHWPKPKNYDEAISLKERTLSPSDFGFHNALRVDNSQIMFFDFEYFGWDDPAKLIGDFLLHPGMQLSKELRSLWIDGAKDIFGKIVIERARVMWPMLGLCWCIILLNEYRKDIWARRTEIVGLDPKNKNIMLDRQLKLSKKYLQRIKETYKDFQFE
ncbi:MAG: phosphotransferase [Acidiferrobacteraceae bacterium]|nr:phosphotransferase [Acidiferrobacteraceae bacterium]|tara:strand:+ start:10986 stop:12647 length:1662 start_codon:yes stop_codon:yes gene_type:complete